MENNKIKKSYTRKIELAALISVIFAIVCGGPYGIEEAIPAIGPGLTLLLLFIVPLFWSLPISFITAEISSAFPQRGGYITWIKNSFGDFWSFQIGWLSLVRSIVETALYPILFVDYLKYFYPYINKHNSLLICIGIVAVFTLLNLLGIKVMGFSSLIMTFIVLIPFAILVVISFFKARTFLPFLTFSLPGKPWTNCLGIGMLILIWNYNGWEDFSTCITEVKNPAKNFPLAILINIPLISMIYAVTIYACLCATSNWQNWKSGQFSLIAREVGGSWLGALIVIAILFGLLNQLSTILLYTSRIPSTLAHHKFLPRFLGYLIRKNRVPWISLIICSALICFFCLFSFKGLIEIDIFLYSFLLLFEIMTFLKLRKTNPEKQRLIKVPGNNTIAFIISLLPFTLLATALYNNGFNYLNIFILTFILGLIIWMVSEKVKTYNPSILTITE
ncbi:MAG: APC family permease [Armatimonadetes bacterium]|nr:APC family permease [Armatimonadota bacterium]